MPIVVIDTETTGKGHKDNPPRVDAVVQVGIAWRGSDMKVKTWSEICNPGVQYYTNGRADGAFKVNGLSIDKIRKAKSAKQVAGKLHAQLEKIEFALNGPIEFRAYNKDFDQGFLSKTPWGIPEQKWGPCIMEATKMHLQKRWVNLKDATLLLGIDSSGLHMHDAAHDAHAALLIHEKISGNILPINRKAVSSTNLASVGYDKSRCVLEIEFKKGVVHQYVGVPESIYLGLMRADSHGKFFLKNIQGKFSVKKI